MEYVQSELLTDLARCIWFKCGAFTTTTKKSSTQHETEENMTYMGACKTQGYMAKW